MQAPATTRVRGLAHASGLVIVAAALGCGTPPPGRTFFDRDIQPILTQTCSRGTGGCHLADPGDPFGVAAGNFDVTSYQNVQKRRDLLQPFGPYSLPPLLIKAVGPGALQVEYNGAFLDLQIPHVGGNNLAVGSDAYLTLLSWLANGATENGLPPPTPPQTGHGGCGTLLPPGFDPAPYAAHPAFAQFRDQVEPILEAKGCGAAACHGEPQADFYVTCGADDTQLAFNFSQAWAFVADPPDDSQLLRIPLAVGAGGGPHAGGDHFASREDDPDYQTIKAWAAEVGQQDFGAGDPRRQFFAEHVQPMLIARGCQFPACHSPEVPNDLKLRAGSQGFYSAISLEKNYHLLRDEFMALEYPDARRSRAVAKGIVREHGGIAHRGGFVLEGGGPTDPARCPPFDPATSSAFCTIQAWLDLERAPLVAAGQVLPLGAGDPLPIVYVDRRPTAVATPLETTYQPDSDLMIATATLDAAGAITSVGPPTSLLDGCAGAADRSTVDVRAPDVRHDGDQVVFAMRTSASDRLSIWAVDLDGQHCTRLTAAQPDTNGLEIHDFDPAWSPDGAWIVFASTRGYHDPVHAALGFVGPTKSRKLFLPQSDLWRMQADGTAAEAMTFLSNSEIAPQFKRNGRMIMTTEKVSRNADGSVFYQLAGRRLNWDLTDYHPLFGQRATSVYADRADLSQTRPSIGYQQCTDIREAADGDFLVILSDAGVKGGAGALGVFNRSVGPFEAGRDDPSYVRSLSIIDPAATGRATGNTDGAYRSPFELPDGRILVSYAATTGNLAAATSFDWRLVAIDRVTGGRQPLIAGGRGAQVDGVAALRSPPRGMYYNHRQLVFGGSINPDLAAGPLPHAIVHMPDAPMIFTMLTANLRRGRPVDAFRAATHLKVWVQLPMAGDVPNPTGGDIYEVLADPHLVNPAWASEAPLASDGSVKIQVPAELGAVVELTAADGRTVVRMGEEHELGPGEQITMGIREELFDAVCGGCHGSVSGNELDVHVTPDALTGASRSLSADSAPTLIGP